MKCLVIDDKKEVTDAISLFLKSENISCKVINQGKEGLEAIRNENFDLVFLDLAMPEFSGYDIIKKLKEDNLMERKNIVVITASSMSDKNIEDLKLMGVKAVIRKPLSLDELKKNVERFKHD